MQAQQKYGKTGKFAVVLSFVQQYDDEAGEFLKKNAPTVSSYLQVNLPHAPCGRGIPHAVLMDHTGKVVGQGGHTELLKQLDKLVAAAPTPPSPILGGVEVKLCKDQAAQLGAGKPIAPIIAQLTQFSKNNDDRAKEAGKLIAAVTAYVAAEQARLEGSADASPAQTSLELNDFCLQVKGMTCEKDLNALVLKIKKDPNVSPLCDVMKKVKAIQAKNVTKGSASSLDNQVVAGAKASLDKIIANKQIVETIRKEAERFKTTF